MEGGDNHLIRDTYLRLPHTKRAKKKKRNHPTKKMTDTLRLEKKRIAWEHFRARMNLPIGSSSYGIPLTSEEANDIKIIREKLGI